MLWGRRKGLKLKGSRVAFLAAGAFAVTLSSAPLSLLYAAEKARQSAEEHLAIARSYFEKAEAYREEIETHRQMLETYKKRVAISPKVPFENPWVRKMRLHCEGYIREAKRQMAEALKLAEYHTFQAKELEGR